ncbi:flagellar hook-length control protein FliK [Roseovarius aestuarii]|uniref:Flagellar hook-length control protein FliK n=1 Tax=Roseovarius aestuarii TaxID=475083 RepID=A0A1X7BQL4_9RHOB|nr:flagellar hook-length control protein FliK [Roseovarius aestuarii]SMC11880.1 Flagellar hook-length control protein FliK [Roseovarius aestuarii]
MQSQISQVAPGHRSPPIFAGTGKERNERGPDASRDTEDFQSILEEPSAHTSESGTSPDKATDDGAISASPDRPEVDVVEKEKTEGYELLSDASGDADEVAPPDTITRAKGEENVATPESETRDTPAPQDQSAGHVPPWFAVPQNPDDGPRRMQPDRKVAAEVIGSAPPTQSTILREQASNDARQAPLTASLASDANVPTTRTDRQVPNTPAGTNNTPDQPRETPGVRVKSAVTDAAHEGNAKLVALANTPGQSDKTNPERAHLTERQSTPDQIARNSPATRHSQPAAPVHATAMPLTAPPALNASDLQGKMIDTGKVHWISEAGFAADTSAAEMPATSRLQQATLLQQPDLPRNIAIQLAQAMRQAGMDRPMELTLNPAELGRVRISMQAVDGAMTVHVLADRPDTLDLMRRHIDILAQEFHEIGYGQADFAFGQSAPDGDGPTDSDSEPGTQATPTAGGTVTEDAPADIGPHLTLLSDRVDIRL